MTSREVTAAHTPIHRNSLNMKDIDMVMQLHYHARVFQWESYRDYCSRDFCR